MIMMVRIMSSTTRCSGCLMRTTAAPSTSSSGSRPLTWRTWRLSRRSSTGSSQPLTLTAAAPSTLTRSWRLSSGCSGLLKILKKNEGGNLYHVRIINGHTERFVNQKALPGFLKIPSLKCAAMLNYWPIIFPSRFAGIEEDPDLLASCVIDVRWVKDVFATFSIKLCHRVQGDHWPGWGRRYFQRGIHQELHEQSIHRRGPQREEEARLDKSDENSILCWLLN